MSIERSAEETKQHHIEMMGGGLGHLYHLLWNEVAWLHAKWGEYVEIFGTKPSRIDLINQAGGSFFRILQDSLWDDVLLHIARLTDPPRSAGKSNLTIQRLPDLISDERVKEKICGLIGVAKERSEFCRDWRNRKIAHRDLGLAMQSGAEPLASASRLKVKETLSALANVINAVASHYLETTVLFELTGKWNGAVDLLYVIDDGLKRRQEIRARLESGEYRPIDLAPRDI